VMGSAGAGGQSAPTLQIPAEQQSSPGSP
jgi:hypothetical protein